MTTQASAILPSTLEAPEVTLTAEEAEDVEKRLKALSLVLDAEDEYQATFKIEVVFDKRKTNRGAFPGSVVLFRVGSGLAGEGDEVLYPCPSRDLTGQPCAGIIEPTAISAMLGLAICPKCQQKWKRDELKEVTAYYLPPEKWAHVIAREFFRLSCDADISMKIAERDLRQGSRMELAAQRGGEALYQARSSRRTITYRLVDIIKDVNAGAEVEKRIRAYITA